MSAGRGLRAEGIAKTFHGGGGEPVAALASVDLAIAAGEFASIVGPSGCGKSTLLGVLAGLIPASAGRVLIDGSEPQRLLGNVGYMPQRDLLMPWRTVLDNVALGVEIGRAGRREARALAAAELGRFGLAGFEHRRPASLSGGMRQRAALLRTFLAGRDVMLLDEPFGALDALTRQAMQAWLLEVWREDRKTVLFVTHDVDEAIFLSDRVHVMSARPGRIALSVEIALPRPRSHELTTSAEFIAHKEQLLEPLRAATLAQAGVEQ